MNLQTNSKHLSLFNWIKKLLKPFLNLNLHKNYIVCCICLFLSQDTLKLSTYLFKRRRITITQFLENFQNAVLQTTTKVVMINLEYTIEHRKHRRLSTTSTKYPEEEKATTISPQFHKVTKRATTPAPSYLTITNRMLILKPHVNPPRWIL